MAGVLFEDIFVIKDLDIGGKKFERVSRIFSDSESLKFNLILDVNTQIYPMYSGEKFRMVLSSTLNEDRTPMPDFYNRLAEPSPFMDHFDYVMHGKVYKVDDENSHGSNVLSIYVSFGGLLMNMKGDATALAHVELDKDIFLLIKKIAF